MHSPSPGGGAGAISALPRACAPQPHKMAAATAARGGTRTCAQRPRKQGAPPSRSRRP